MEHCGHVEMDGGLHLWVGSSDNHVGWTIYVALVICTSLKGY